MNLILNLFSFFFLGPTVLLEKNKLIGEETSSRNSEVNKTIFLRF